MRLLKCSTDSLIYCYCEIRTACVINHAALCQTVCSRCRCFEMLGSNVRAEIRWIMTHMVILSSWMIFQMKLMWLKKRHKNPTRYILCACVLIDLFSLVWCSGTVSHRSSGQNTLTNHSTRSATVRWGTLCMQVIITQSQ